MYLRYLIVIIEVFQHDITFIFNCRVIIKHVFCSVIKWVQLVSVPEMFWSCNHYTIKVHVEFLKRNMFLRKSTNNVVVNFELGRCPMSIQRKLWVLKYWCYLLKPDDCILQACYEQLFCEYEKREGNCPNWVSKVRNELYYLGLGHV